MVKPRQLTLREAIDSNQPEIEFQNTVTELAVVMGWWWWHDYDSRKNEPGLPDLILVRAPRFVVAEIKRQRRSRVSEAQERTLALMAPCPGIETYLWKPSDWDDVRRVLARGDVPPEGLSSRLR